MAKKLAFSVLEKGYKSVEVRATQTGCYHIEVLMPTEIRSFKPTFFWRYGALVLLSDMSKTGHG